MKKRPSDMIEWPLLGEKLIVIVATTRHMLSRLVALGVCLDHLSIQQDDRALWCTTADVAGRVNAFRLLAFAS